MLTIRLQRTGRTGHAQFRVVVQDSRSAPASGKVVAQLGSYNPHTKTVILDKEKAETFMKNGAQPSDRIIRLFSAEKLKLPLWVEKPAKGQKRIRHAEKLRRNQPAKSQETTETTPVSEVENSEPEVSEPVENVDEAPTEAATEDTAPKES